MDDGSELQVAESTTVQTPFSVHEPTAEYKRASGPMVFLGQTVEVGQRLPYNTGVKAVQMVYRHPRGELFTGDCIEWLSSLETASVDCVFADPPYNVKKAEWDSFDSQEAYISWSMKWIEQAARALKPQSNFGIASTFKSNHFLGYTIALNRLDGVYYVDPRPDMVSNELLREQIGSFSSFIVRDLWTLTG